MLNMNTCSVRDVIAHAFAHYICETREMLESQHLQHAVYLANNPNSAGRNGASNLAYACQHGARMIVNNDVEGVMLSPMAIIPVFNICCKVMDIPPAIRTAIVARSVNL